MFTLNITILTFLRRNWTKFWICYTKLKTHIGNHFSLLFKCSFKRCCNISAENCDSIFKSCKSQVTILCCSFYIHTRKNQLVVWIYTYFYGFISNGCRNKLKLIVCIWNKFFCHFHDTQLCFSFSEFLLKFASFCGLVSSFCCNINNTLILLIFFHISFRINKVLRNNSYSRIKKIKSKAWLFTPLLNTPFIVVGNNFIKDFFCLIHICCLHINPNNVGLFAGNIYI